ncbi:iron ABC transporter substrate-binding protein [Asticcacaulis sp. BYS171W]|uniref:Iron ABC transporter substrate-binding protein n=1 Tax=Asticcacaulis aquaticus TaxID=2984212 RepID=A0ABT5HPE3_9CAUL|nr:ABC transporter substrate-binding protein [Asticcacaulis aquaticus]MDC7681934.1 iron ABC transporter substrate-binding protein [Asticcacaulis aquaticus]
MKIIAFWLCLAVPVSAAPLRVVSLDMCADQYVLALLPKDRIAGLSLRARHQDAYFRDRVGDLPLRRATLETLLAVKPDAVVRTWGGDAKLLKGLEARGIKIIQINDVNNFSQAADEVKSVAQSLGVPQVGLRETARMSAALTAIGTPAKPRRVLYYTPSGFSAGRSTWVGQLIAATGNELVAGQDFFYYLSPETFLSARADVYALGFYADAYAMRRAPGRHPLVRERINKAPHVTIPSPMLACSAWYAAFDLPKLAERLR